MSPFLSTPNKYPDLCRFYLNLLGRRGNKEFSRTLAGDSGFFIYSLNALEVGKLLRYAQLAYLQPASEAAIDGMCLNTCVSDNCITNSQNRAAI